MGKSGTDQAKLRCMKSTNGEFMEKFSQRQNSFSVWFSGKFVAISSILKRRGNNNQEGKQRRSGVI